MTIRCRRRETTGLCGSGRLNFASRIIQVMNRLEALKQFTTVVAGTCDFKHMGAFQPADASTKPSPILKAVQEPQYAPLPRDTAAEPCPRAIDALADRLQARFGCEILSNIPGRVSTQIDARLTTLAATNAPLASLLHAHVDQQGDIQHVVFDENAFRLALNEDAMATEKLAEGIRAFCADAVKLEALLLRAA